MQHAVGFELEEIGLIAVLGIEERAVEQAHIGQRESFKLWGSCGRLAGERRRRGGRSECAPR
jgi:hypothetical protein